jgi:hypothetical protein
VLGAAYMTGGSRSSRRGRRGRREAMGGRGLVKAARRLGQVYRGASSAPASAEYCLSGPDVQYNGVAVVGYVSIQQIATKIEIFSPNK